MLSIMQLRPDAFLAYGGHSASGGFEVSNEKIHMLADELEQAACELGHESTEKKEFFDAEISLDDVSWNLYKEVEKLAPYGTGNPKPLFLIRNAYIDAVKAFGKEKNHTEIGFLDGSNRKISAIQFFAPVSALPAHAKPQSRIDMVAHLEKSTFKNYPELRLRIVDIL